MCVCHPNASHDSLYVKPVGRLWSGHVVHVNMTGQNELSHEMKNTVRYPFLGEFDVPLPHQLGLTTTIAIGIRLGVSVGGVSITPVTHM